MEIFNFNLQLYSAILVFEFLFVMFELLQSIFTIKQKEKKINQEEIIWISKKSHFIPLIQYENREKSVSCILLNSCVGLLVK